jgi:hypothetical protein
VAAGGAGAAAADTVDPVDACGSEGDPADNVPVVAPMAKSPDTTLMVTAAAVANAFFPSIVPPFVRVPKETPSR